MEPGAAGWEASAMQPPLWLGLMAGVGPGGGVKVKSCLWTFEIKLESLELYLGIKWEKKEDKEESLFLIHSRNFQF